MTFILLLCVPSKTMSSLIYSHGFEIVFERTPCNFIVGTCVHAINEKMSASNSVKTQTSKAKIITLQLAVLKQVQLSISLNCRNNNLHFQTFKLSGLSQIHSRLFNTAQWSPTTAQGTTCSQIIYQVLQKNQIHQQFF